MQQEYGQRGTIGVLTPQANTTVEPELWSLLPPGWSLLNARLTSRRNSIETRLLDYAEQLCASATQFSNAPIGALAVACTGLSYLIDEQRQQRLITAVEQQRQVTCVMAASATVAALRVLNANRIALLSPYPDALTRASVDYWQTHGFEVLRVTGPSLRDEQFHPIYSMQQESVYNSYRELADSGADAILMLGTGMPTLAAILRGNKEGLPVALSCNIALAWRAVYIIAGENGPDAKLQHWLTNPCWTQRYRMLTGMCV